MNKRQAMKEIKKIMTGRSSYTKAVIKKEGRKWIVETCTSFPEYGYRIQHCCNEMTNAEVKFILDTF